MSGSFMIALTLHREIEDRQMSIQTNLLLHHHISPIDRRPVMCGGLDLKDVWLKLEGT